MSHKKYTVYLCKDCNNEFLTTRGRYCPECGDNIFVDRQRNYYMDRPIVYNRTWTEEEDEILIESIRRGHTYREVAEELGRTEKSVHMRLSRLREKQEIVRKEPEYALYKGDEVLCVGTIDEIAKHQKVARKTIFHYQTPAYKRRKKGGRTYRELVKL